MASDLRNEPWRATHRRLLAKQRTGQGRMMGRRLRVPADRGGQGRPVEVPPGATYAPMSWDGSEQRVRDLNKFRPTIAKDSYDAHRQLVVDLVLRTDYYDRLRDRHLASTLHRYLAFAEARGYSTDPVQLLTGDRIDEFIKATYATGSQSTHRWRLRQLAATVFPPPPEEAMKRSAPLPPHTHNDMVRFLAAADELIAGHKGTCKTRQELHREVRNVLALTFGAGCNGKVVHRVTESWLREQPDGLWLHRPRLTLPTPIAQPWADYLRHSLTGSPDAWLVRPKTPNSRSEQVGKLLSRARGISPGLTGFDTDRAARTWQVAVLKASRFVEVAAMLGFKPGSQTPVDLAANLPVHDDDETRELLRRWAS